MFRCRIISLLSFLMLCCVSVHGRDGGPYTVTASILDKSGTPVAGATMLLVRSGLWGISDKDGNVEIKNVPRLPAAYKVSMLGKEKSERTARLTSEYS